MKIKNAIFVIIRILMVAALIGAVVFFVFLKQQESKVPFATVKEQLTEAVSSDRMELSTARFLKKYYGLNADDYDGVLLYAPLTNMDAEELLLIKCKDASQVESVKEAILERQKTKETTFEGYAPEQYDLCRNYILDEQGTYLFLIISPDAEELDKVFKDSL